MIRSKGEGYRISESISVVVGSRRAASATSGGHEDVPDVPDEEQNVPDEEQNVPDHVPVNGRNVPDRVPNVPDLNDRQQWVMSLIKKGSEVRANMVVTQFGCSQKTAKRDLSNMKDQHLVRFVGSPRTGHYILS